jgi:hypothetical protein
MEKQTEHTIQKNTRIVSAFRVTHEPTSDRVKVELETPEGTKTFIVKHVFIEVPMWSWWDDTKQPALSMEGAYTSYETWEEKDGIKIK